MYLYLLYVYFVNLFPAGSTGSDMSNRMKTFLACTSGSSSGSTSDASNESPRARVTASSPSQPPSVSSSAGNSPQDDLRPRSMSTGNHHRYPAPHSTHTPPPGITSTTASRMPGPTAVRQDFTQLSDAGRPTPSQQPVQQSGYAGPGREDERRSRSFSSGVPDNPSQQYYSNHWKLKRKMEQVLISSRRHRR